MKKIILFFLSIGCIFMILGCSKKPGTPQEQFKSYLNDWQHENFASMYEKLSSKTKKQISKEAFIKRYQNIYKDLQVKDLSIEPEFKLKKEVDPDEDERASLPFSVKMTTIAGPVSFHEKAVLQKETHKKDTPNWYVEWTTKMIFPQLTDPSIEVHIKTLPGERGEIIDRNGQPLAANGKVVQIGFWPGKMKADSKQKFSQISGISMKTIENKLSASWVKADSFVPIQTYSIDETNKYSSLLQIPGVKKTEINARVYPYHKAAGHLTGYIGSITADQLKKQKDKGYDETDVIGKTGFEKIYEKRLRPHDGAVIYTTDKGGTQLETIAKKQPKNGETIQLTIDAKLQQSLYNAMKGKKKMDTGAAVAIHPKNGQVLALVSTPTYDPNHFILGISREQWQDLQNNPEKPLINRFTNAYAPGSSFKPIVASIALETHAIDPEQKVRISGTTWQPPDSNWGDIHITRVDHVQEVNLEEALIYSDNIYFAQTALKIGGEKFIEQGKKFGFDEKFPFIYPIEQAQIATDGHFSNEIQLANSGYGQGQVQISTLQLAVDYTSFINDGNLVKPVLELKEANNRPKIWHKNIISSKTADTIKKDLIQVVQNPVGTGHAAKIKGHTIAGKTGTAELKKGQDVKNGKENGWFVGFNVKDPKILIAMIVENVQESVRGEIHGSHYVVPKVTNVLKKYLK